MQFNTFHPNNHLVNTNVDTLIMKHIWPNGLLVNQEHLVHMPCMFQLTAAMGLDKLHGSHKLERSG